MLKFRVRDAVAGEMGKAVGDAVRDLLTAVLSRPMSQPIPSQSVQVEEHWRDDDDDEWHDHYDSPTPVASFGSNHSEPQSIATPSAALMVLVIRWLISRRDSLLTSIGVTLNAAVLMFGNNPLTASLTDALAAAMELLSLTPTNS